MGIFFRIISIIVVIHQSLQDNINSTLNQLEYHITQSEKQDAQICYEEAKQFIKEGSMQNLKVFYRLYAKYLMYGLNKEFKGEIDYAKVIFYFKQSAQMGDAEAYSYLGILGTYKLDGVFNMITNIERINDGFTQINDTTNDQKKLSLRKLESFLTFHHLSEPMIDLYFASLQGSDFASLAMSYKFSKGLGVEKNCSNAALFIEPILKKWFITSPSNDKMIFQNKRLDYLLFNSDLFTTHSIDAEFIQIFEGIEIVTKESLHDVFHLAYNYLYGINGVKRNYNKAYELFSKVAQDTESMQAKAFMAQMIIEGLGPVKDKSLALKLFTEAAAFNESKALNGLGYMQLNGIETPKNVNKAMENFKKSADLGNADGNYNYGSLFLLPSSPEIDRNTQTAFAYLSLASAQGHALAQYTLALLYLDGVDLFYSCELALRLMQQASTRLFIADVMKTANELFQKGKYPQSLIRYLELASLGYPSALGNNQNNIYEVNGAVLADHFSSISDIQYHKINENMKQDDFYIFAKQHNIQMKQIDDPFLFLFETYIQLARGDDNTVSFQYAYDLLLELTEPKPYKTKTIGTYISSKLYGYCKLDNEGYCYLRSGDYYYYGIFEDIDYQEAYYNYQHAAQDQESPLVVQAYAYFNLGYMNALGVGRQINEDLALKYFNDSLTKDPIVPGITANMVLNAVQIIHYSYHEQNYDKQNNIKYIIKRVIDLVENSLIWIFLQILDNRKIIYTVTISLLSITLYGIKMKIQNTEIHPH